MHPYTGKNMDIKNALTLKELLLTVKKGVEGAMPFPVWVSAEIAEIKQRSLGFWPKFELFSDRKLVGSLRRYYGLGTEMLFVKKLNWLILGNSLTFNYKIYHGRRCVLSLHEVELASGNYLELTIADINDEALCLCIVAILDFWAKGGLKGGSKENDPLLNLSYIH